MEAVITALTVMIGSLGFLFFMAYAAKCIYEIKSYEETRKMINDVVKGYNKFIKTFNKYIKEELDE